MSKKKKEKKKPLHKGYKKSCLDVVKKLDGWRTVTRTKPAKDDSRQSRIFGDDEYKRGHEVEHDETSGSSPNSENGGAA